MRKAEDGRRETARLAGTDEASGASQYSRGDLVGGGVADGGMVGGDSLFACSALATATPRSDRIDSPASSSSRGEGGGAGESESS